MALYLEHINNYEMAFQVSPDYCSSGIWDIKDEYSNIGYDAINLPSDLACEFMQWQDVFDKCALTWDDKEEKRFYDKGLQLAKKLKTHFKDKAYVEYLEQGNEIRYYSVMADYDYLWQDDLYGCDIITEAQEMRLDFDTKEMKLLDKELYQWAQDYFVEFEEYLFFDKPYKRNKIKEREILKRGEILTKRLQEIVPPTCVIEYKYLGYEEW